MNHAIVIDNLTVTYDQHPAVHHLTTTFNAGTLTSLIGPNGSGKTTLLQTIAGLRAPSEGRVTLQGFTVKDIAYLPQQDQIDKTFPMVVRDLVASGLWRSTGPFARFTRKQTQTVDVALAKVGLRGFEHRMIGSLSGGQFQRMLFARLIVQDAPVLLLDEPFNAIDEKTSAELLSLIDDWHGEARTILIVTHDVELARQRFPNSLLMARDLIACGNSQDVLTAENIKRARQMNEPFDATSALCLRGAT